MFFELLQVSLGNRGSLSATPTSDEWAAIYDESERQAVTGVILCGLDRLPLEQRPPKAILLQWIGMVQMIEQRNQVMDKHCGELLKMLKEQGVRGSILKGQGVALLYDKELRPLRQSGDIDVYVDCGIERAMDFAKTKGQKNPKYAYKHLHLEIWDDTEIEMHVRVEVLLNLVKNKKLQQWFKNHNDEAFGSHYLEGCLEMTTPTVEFNVFYILLHIYRHFLYEGVGMRQIVDYYMVLRTVHYSRLTVYDYVETVRVFGMEKFARGLMWVMKEALGMPEEWMLWESNEKEGEFILKQIMTGGNFGHYHERLKHGGGKLGTIKAILVHNMHLLGHYPSDALWAPIYFIWLMIWKLRVKK